MEERPPPVPADADLVVRARGGDRDAFAAIYDRYADPLHDFCWSMLRDADDAADATQETFLRAVEQLGQVRDPAKLRPWLYSIARHEALRRLRSRKRQIASEAMPELPDPARGPDAAASQEELRALVWDAAGGLGDRDRLLLDLHVRQGLDGAELAEAAGVRPATIYTLLSRLREQVERSLGALLVARVGRRECGELDAILAGWDGRFTTLIRKRVARHVDSCDVCGERRRTAASPMALLSAVPVMLAPPQLRDVVLTAYDAHAGTDADDGSGGDSATPGDPKGPADDRGDAASEGVAASSRHGADATGFAWWQRPGRGAMLASGAAVVVGGIVAGMLLLGPDDVGDVPTVASTSSPTTTAAPVSTPRSREPSPEAPTAPETTQPTQDNPAEPPDVPEDEAEELVVEEPQAPEPSEPPPPLPPGELAVSTTTLDLGAEAPSGAAELRNVGGAPLTYTITSSVPWLVPDHDAGELPPGAARELRVDADRSELAEGDHRGTVNVTSGGENAAVEVRVSVERPPTIGQVSADPREIGVARCQRNTAQVVALVDDESGVAAVELSWQEPASGASGRIDMDERSGSWYRQLGPFDEPGQVSWRVTATDARGSSASSGPHMLTVSRCVQ